MIFTRAKPKNATPTLSLEKKVNYTINEVGCRVGDVKFSLAAHDRNP